jgi:hypothetical protein
MNKQRTVGLFVEQARQDIQSSDISGMQPSMPTPYKLQAIAVHKKAHILKALDISRFLHFAKLGFASDVRALDMSSCCVGVHGHQQ